MTEEKSKMLVVDEVKINRQLLFWAGLQEMEGKRWKKRRENN